MKTFSLDHLSETEFEEFCFDLLYALGATQMSWRKGTGLNSSPADQGRDIECHFERKEIDGKTSEKWFVECKHYKQGVPPEKLQGLLTWATSERPDVALIMASNFLSNPAKHSLEAFQTNNKPSFKIKRWERPDLERFVLGKPLVMRKYGLGGEFEFLNILHPAHVTYIRHPPINTFDYFFGLLDRLEPTERRSFFCGSFMSVINPGFDKATDAKRQTLGELARGKITYTEFRKKCYEIGQHISPHFLVQAIVFHELAAGFNCADKTSIQQVRGNMKASISFFEKELEDPTQDRETIEACIQDLKSSIEDIEERTAAHYERYRLFCEEIVVPLLEEKMPTLEAFQELMGAEGQ